MTYKTIGAATPTLAVSIIALATALGSGIAAAIPMNGSDDTSTSLQQSSFNTGANWLGGAAPAANNVYETAGNRLNSPWNASNSEFLGDRLTVQNSIFALTASNNGIVTVNNDDSVGGNPGGLVLDNSTVLSQQDGNNVRLGGLITLGAGGGRFNAGNETRGITIESKITGAGTLQVYATAGVGGEVVFSNPDNDSNLDNDYTGLTTVRNVGNNAVTLRAADANVFSPNSVVEVQSGMTLELDGHDNAIAGLTSTGIGLSSNGTVENASDTPAELTLRGDGTNSFSGSLQDGAGAGALSLRKSGSGTQILTTANSYTGSTVIDGGTLKIENADALGDGPVSISGTGTLGLDPVSIGFDFSMEGRADTTAHVLAEDAGNEITSASTVTLIDGSQSPNNYTFATDQTGDTLVINGNIVDTSNGNDTLNFGGGGTGTVNSAIVMAGPGADTVAKIGSGDWTLAGAVTADAISVNEGDLTLSGGANTGTVTVGDSVGRTDGSLDLQSQLQTTGDVTVESGSALTQTGGSYIDATDQQGNYVVDGTVSLNGNDASMNGLSGGGFVQNDDDAGDNDNRLTIDPGTSQTFSGTLRDGDGAGDDGTLALTKTGSGTQILTGASSYTGGTSIEGGKLKIENADALGVGPVSISGTGTLGLDPVSIGFDFSMVGRADTTAHVLAEDAGNEITSASTVTLIDGSQSPNNYTFATDQTGDTLVINGTIVDTSNGNDTLNFGGGGTGTVNSAIVMAGPGADTVAKIGSGDWTLAGAVTANAINVNEGGLTLAGGASTGTVTVGDAGGGTDGSLDLQSQLQTTGDVTVESGSALTQTGGSYIDATDQQGNYVVDGTVSLNGNDASMNGLSGGGFVQNDDDAGDNDNRLTIDPGTSQTFIGTLRDGDGAGDDGTLALTKTGGGSQILTGASSYTGGTIIEGGALQLANSAAAGNGDITVTNTDTDAGSDTYGTLELVNASPTNGITLDGRGTDDTAHIDSLDGDNELSGDVSLAGGGRFNVVSTGTDSNEKLTLSGAITDADDQAHNLVLGGAGNGNLTGPVTFDGTATDTITKDGVGTWSLGGTVSGADAVTINAGTLENGSGGTLTTGTLTIDGGIYNMAGQGLNVGTLAGSGGTITTGALVDPTIQLGGDVVDGTSNVDITDGGDGAEIDLQKIGADTETLNGDLTLDTDTGNGETGDVSVTAGRLNLSGDNSYGQTTVSGGVLGVRSNNALGSATTAGEAFNTEISGTGSVLIDGTGLDVNEAFDLLSRDGNGVHLGNVANTNTILGAINLTDTDEAGPDDTYTIRSIGGTLQLDGGIASSLTSGNRILDLGGAGSGTVSSLTFDEAGNELNKTGVGTWRVSDATMANGTISSQAGILELAGTADLTGSMVYEVLAQAELDVIGIGGLSVADTQTLQGGRSTGTDTGGLVDGNVIAASGAIVSPGSAADATQELRISGNMDLGASTLKIDINGLTDKDVLAVLGDLTLDNAILDLALGNLALYDTAYVFATYGAQGGTNFMFSSVTGDLIPDGYTIDYMYNGNQIALVNSNMPTVPVPLPLGLIGIGLLAWGGLRAKQRHAEAKG